MVGATVAALAEAGEVPYVPLNTVAATAEAMSATSRYKSGEPVMLTVGPEVAALALAGPSVPNVPLNTVAALALAAVGVSSRVDWKIVGLVVAATALAAVIPERVSEPNTTVGATVAPEADAAVGVVVIEPKTTEGSTVAAVAETIDDQVTIVGVVVTADADAMSG
jgi:hypothetical protein